MNKKLLKLRNEINNVDQKIILLIFRRLTIVKKIARLKKKNHLSIIDNIREKEIVIQIMQQAQSKKINKSFIVKLFRLIINESKERQKEIMYEK